MKTVKEFVKKHLKKFILGSALTVVTFGFWAVYKFIKNKGRS